MKRRLALYHERRNHSRSARKVPLSLLLFGSILGTNRRPCPSRVRSIVNKCKTSYIDRAVRGDLLRRSPRSPVVFLQYGMRRSSTSSFHWRDCGSLFLSQHQQHLYPFNFIFKWRRHGGVEKEETKCPGDDDESFFFYKNKCLGVCYCV